MWPQSLLQRLYVITEWLNGELKSDIFFYYYSQWQRMFLKFVLIFPTDTPNKRCEMNIL